MSDVQEDSKLLIAYIKTMALSFILFVVFALTLKGAYLIGNIWPDVGIICKIVAWPLTIFGAVCCIVTAFKSSVRYLKFLGLWDWFLRM